jgi:hypothetical protein
MNKILHIIVNDNAAFSETGVIRMIAPGQRAAVYYAEWQNQGFAQFARSVVQTKPPEVSFNHIVFEPAEIALWRLRQILSVDGEILKRFLDNGMSFQGDRLVLFEGAITSDYSETYVKIAKVVFAHINSEEFRIVRHPNNHRHHIEHIRSVSGGATQIWHHLHRARRG